KLAKKLAKLAKLAKAL
nr:modelin-5, mod-5=antiviral amphiphilic peptide [synthetic, Peptide Synthetic, 16 aa] [synthetic construct]